MKLKALLSAALLLAAACAPAADPAPAGPAAQAAPANINPVGRYEFSTTVQGQGITGAAEIAGTPGAYSGQITTSITPPIPITGVTVNGQVVTVTGNTPDGPLVFTMTFSDATTFTGGWTLAGDSGTLTGRKVS